MERKERIYDVTIISFWAFLGALLAKIKKIKKFFFQVRRIERTIIFLIIVFLATLGGAETETTTLYLCVVILPLMVMIDSFFVLLLADHYYSGKKISEILQAIFAYEGKDLEHN